MARCLPCEAAARTNGLGRTAAPLGALVPEALGALPPELTRDLTSGVVAFALPLGYHYFAPKKWPRTNVFGNLAAVVVLYFGTSWATKKIQESA